MKVLLSLVLLVGVAYGERPEEPALGKFLHDRAQMTAATAGFCIHAVDLAQTMHHLDHTTWYEGRAYHGREEWMPTQNKFAISTALLGSAALTTLIQYRLYRAHHPRLAIFGQVLSSAVSGAAIYSSFHSKYTVGR